jgi:hypothetical protein
MTPPLASAKPCHTGGRTDLCPTDLRGAGGCNRSVEPFYGQYGIGSRPPHGRERFSGAGHVLIRRLHVDPPPSIFWVKVVA